ncbi:50S ribosomal protein L22 [Helicobacter sp. 11S03491-1]|uniref:50S ribosomal protein L22 n=1 Tax=Helicobacter sp. 11S03491-1 TaxID=1476196 RepID=UPI000BA704B4|nr:50S ribosomal protein L22 [Helicobacter sp. 11S03491-1]PAF42716.1 50S ribosomal protein L22 [Helicobacter sp. 11S03491-1]
MSTSLLKYIRLSPTKARLIAGEIQGMNAELAIASLEFTPNKAARVISKVIASAVANGSYEAQNVCITSCRVDAGPVLRRFMPRAKGRATPIRKPTSHILVEVGLENSKNKKSAPKSASVSEKTTPKQTSKKELKEVKQTTLKKTPPTSKKIKGEDK